MLVYVVVWEVLFILLIRCQLSTSFRVSVFMSMLVAGGRMMSDEEKAVLFHQQCWFCVSKMIKVKVKFGRYMYQLIGMLYNIILVVFSVATDQLSIIKQFVYSVNKQQNKFKCIDKKHHADGWTTQKYTPFRFCCNGNKSPKQYNWNRFSLSGGRPSASHAWVGNNQTWQNVSFLFRIVTIRLVIEKSIADIERLIRNK